MIEFKPWPKTPRFYRDVTITEKIDGTNAAVQIIPVTESFPPDEHLRRYVLTKDGNEFDLVAQSRKRVITPEDDNAGFARWAWDNADHLVNTLGPGTHFGEWWGKGIQRNYGMDRKVFSLFNTAKWGDVLSVEPDDRGLAVVPVLYEGVISDNAIQVVADGLRQLGSVAVPGFMKPEGIVIYHQAANNVFKVLLENDELPKGLVNA
jgi:hypothetical protein